MFNQANFEAALKGCVLCNAVIQSPCNYCQTSHPVGKPHTCSSTRMNVSSLVTVKAGGNPFASGPHEGRYWCLACWMLYWSEHPECLADEESRRHVQKEARLILLERKGLEVLYQEGDSRVCLTERGTLLFQIKPGQGMIAEEYDPDRFALLARAMQAIDTKEIAGYQCAAKSA